MVGKITEGVGFLLFSKNPSGIWELFTIVELESKPQYHKERGMLSFPLETFEERDGNFTGTIDRLIKEEIGVPLNEVVVSGIARDCFQPIPGREDVHTYYGYGLFTGNRERVFAPEDTDIKFAGWWSAELLLRQKVRVEVYPILKHFAENHSSALLDQCAQAVS